ncbi:MAG: T9SS type A sorting domain-containing protein [Chloroherpetonaceae bacterium]|nr:T9SS type A sorting domain-containing protein [Chloroherpetonaceae bacterium]
MACAACSPVPLTDNTLRFYTLGSVNTADAPLPVELISFTGVSSRAGVVLSWATASERESAGFIVNRRILSAGQTEWQVLDDYTRNPALVAKNSTNGAQYSFTDRSDLPAGAVVEYRLDEVSLSGTIERLREVRVETRFSTIVTDFALEQNYPNPFNPTTNIPYQLKERAKVKLEIYNALGQKVATLVDAVQERGNYAPTFNASALSSGVYFYRLTAQGSRETFVQTRKMMLLK